MIKIVFIDHQEESRNRICHALSLQQDFILAGLGTDGYHAITMVREINPNVVLLVPDLPAIDGFQLASMLKLAKPFTGIIMLSDVGRALKEITRIHFTSISGYLTKDTSQDLLHLAIRTVYLGGCLIAPKIADQMDKRQTKEEEFPWDKLSETELAVLDCIRKGLTTREIAEQLHRTEGTIRNYISAVLQKTGLHHRIQIAISAI
ncbi:MAG: response regulator transcription factor [Treponema sp.]|jgi:DNA-binding NarL/FixJ family response regulator|nr:response regulator transcription factor [Treponema sp.]